MLLQAEQMHKMTYISLKMVEVAIWVKIVVILPQGIYNPITAMGFLAMFTS